MWRPLHQCGIGSQPPERHSQACNLATGKVMCRQDGSWHSAGAKLSEENKGKGSNGGGKDESVDAGYGAGMFGTLNAQVEQQKDRMLPEMKISSWNRWKSRVKGKNRINRSSGDNASPELYYNYRIISPGNSYLGWSDAREAGLQGHS